MSGEAAKRSHPRADPLPRQFLTCSGICVKRSPDGVRPLEYSGYLIWRNAYLLRSKFYSDLLTMSYLTLNSTGPMGIPRHRLRAPRIWAKRVNIRCRVIAVVFFYHRPRKARLSSQRKRSSVDGALSRFRQSGFAPAETSPCVVVTALLYPALAVIFIVRSDHCGFRDG